MQRGEATWNDRVLLVMERHGYVEDTYFTWSYSAIPDGGGGIGGVYCACTEETPRVLAERERDRLLTQVESERARLAEAFAQSPAFMAVLSGPDHVFEFANEQYFQLVGRRDILGKPVREAVPEIAGQGYFEILDRVYQSGERFVGTDVRLSLRRQPDRPPEEVFLDFVYQPIHSASGGVIGLMVHGVDLSDRRRATERISRLHAVAAALSEALTTSDVARVTIEQGVAALGATAGSLALLAEDGATLEMVGSVGYPQEIIEPWSRFPLDAPIPLSEAVRRAEPIYMDSPDERLRRYPALARVTARRATQASACIPLLVGGVAIG